MTFDQEYENTVNSGVSVETAKDLKKSVDLLTNILLDDEGNLVDMSDRNGRERLSLVILDLNKKISNLPPVKIADESLVKYKTLCEEQKVVIENARQAERNMISMLKDANAPYLKAVSWFKKGMVFVLFTVSIIIGTFLYCLPTYKTSFEFNKVIRENEKLKKDVELYKDRNSLHIEMLEFIRYKSVYRTKTWEQVEQRFPNYPNRNK